MSVTTQVVPRIEKTSTPRLPQFVFEWHNHVGKVYVVELPGQWEENGTVFVPAESGKAEAWCIHEHTPNEFTHGAFLGIVQTWIRGYRMGKWNERVGTR